MNKKKKQFHAARKNIMSTYVWSMHRNYISNFKKVYEQIYITITTTLLIY